MAGDAHSAAVATCATVGQRVIDIPPNMTTLQRVQWVADQVTKLGVTAEG
jgi:hypothetical protein